MTEQLFPRPPRRKKQPTAAMLRQQLALAADEIIRLRAELHARMAGGWTLVREVPRQPWWVRLADWLKGLRDG